MVIKVTKLREADSPKHPNNIETGRVFRGTFNDVPKVGERFEIGPIGLEYGERGLSTSLVQEIIDANTFRTYNSIYVIEWNVSI